MIIELTIHLYCSLETYTLRSGYHTVKEAENLNERTNACPDSDNPICLVGLRPFMAAKHLMVSGSHLVLLAFADQDTSLNPTHPLSTSLREPRLSETPVSSKWTVYSLTLPSPIDLHKDMIQLANMNRVLSPHGYFQLLCEAHMVLRTSIHHLAWQQFVSTTKPANVDGELEKELESTKEKYNNICLLLANFYILSDKRKEWKLALPYYRMCHLSAIKIIQQAMELWKKSLSSEKTEKHRFLPPGLSHYITEIILNPFCSDKENVQESALADLIIDILGENAIEKLAYVVLRSQAFRQFKTTKIHNHFKKHLSGVTCPDANEAITFALLCIDMGEAGIKDLDFSRRYLQISSAISLSEVCINHYHLLIDENVLQTTGVDMKAQVDGPTETFSDLAILVRDSVPEIFVEVLVSLIKADTLLLGSVLGLFIGSFVSMSYVADHSMQASECSATHNTAMLQMFLETYFQELLNETITPSSISLDADQVQALHTLIRSYLTSLSIPVRFVERNIDSNMFGSRRLYLDKLPPFESSEKLETTMLGADSPDFWCQNSLLKLQSLLCSCLCSADESSHRIVTSFLNIKQDTIGGLSLRLLCCEFEEESEAVHLLADNNPDVLLVYAKENNFGMKGWTVLLKCLQDRLTNEDEQVELHEAWYASMQEILDHLAQTMPLESFLEVLPSSNPQNNEEFQCHIQMCRKNQQAHQIQSLIVSTGNKLLSTLTL